NQVVVGQRFEPADAAAVLAEQSFIVLGPQPEPEPQRGADRRGGGHARGTSRGGAVWSLRAAMNSADQLFALALAASHSAFVICFTPSPLQAFLPAQSCLAVLHSLVPLHALTPSHFTFASSAAFAADRGAAVNAIAAAAASARPESLFTELVLSWAIYAIPR